jgi:zinc transporter 7
MEHVSSPVVASLLAVTVISAIPVVVLWFIAMACRTSGTNGRIVLPPLLLNVLLSFAVGGLLGDTFLHLIPHAFDPHGHEPTSALGNLQPDVEPTISSRDILAQASFSDPLLVSVKPNSANSKGSHGKHNHHDHGHSHGHSHSHAHSGHKHDADGHEHGHDHSAGLKIGSLVLLGMLFFFLVEKISRLHSNNQHSHSHGTGSDTSTESLNNTRSVTNSSAGVNQTTEPNNNDNDTKDGDSPVAKRTRRSASQGRGLLPDASSDNSNNSSSENGLRKRGKSQPRDANVEAESKDHEKEHGHDHGHTVQQEVTNAKLAADLSILGDFVHNFTDGMAIAASFQLSQSAGIATTFAVLVHEIPHELGDFTLLINGGYSVTRAILMQLVTAIGAFLGCGLVLIGASSSGLNAMILPFTAGGFIYIALVAVVPSLMENTSGRGTVYEVLGMLAGVAGMAVIAMYE